MSPYYEGVITREAREATISTLGTVRVVYNFIINEVTNINIFCRWSVSVIKEDWRIVQPHGQQIFLSEDTHIHREVSSERSMWIVLDWGSNSFYNFAKWHVWPPSKFPRLNVAMLNQNSTSNIYTLNTNRAGKYRKSWRIPWWQSQNKCLLQQTFESEKKPLDEYFSFSQIIPALSM